jgi:hypothetical protein
MAASEWSAQPEERQDSPWSARAAELETTEGPYADFVAFEEWFARESDRHCQLLPDTGFDALDIYQRVALYSMFVDVLREAARCT